MALGQRQQGLHGAREVGIQQGDGLARSQSHGRVHHILAGAGVVHVARRIGVEERHRLGERAHQWNGDAAGAGAVAHDLGHVEQLDAAARDDGAGRIGRDQPFGGLGTGQRGLEAQHAGDDGLVAEGF